MNNIINYIIVMGGIGMNYSNFNSDVKTTRLDCKELDCKPVVLFNHNEVTYTEFEKQLLKTDKLAVVQATGTGKSFIFMKFTQEVLKHNPMYTNSYYSGTTKLGKNIVIVVPNMSLKTGYEGYEEWSSYIKVITYQKINSLYFKDKVKFNELVDSIGVLIFDEMHRAGAEKWGEACREAMNKVLAKNARLHKLHENKLRTSEITVDEYRDKLLYFTNKVLGFTATPERDAEGVDMVQELFDGQCVYGPDLAEAIQKGILPSFEYHVLLHGKTFENINETIADAKRKLGKIQEVEPEKAEEIRSRLGRIELNLEATQKVQEELKFILKKKPVQKWIVFCKDTEELNDIDLDLKSWFGDLGKVNIYKMLSKDGEKDVHKSENLENLQKFMQAEKGVNILKVINMLNEGVHVKNIDGAILLRGTHSKIMYLQQIGRTLSASHKGDKPIIIDFMYNYLNLKDYGKKEQNNENSPMQKLGYIQRIIGGSDRTSEFTLTGMQAINIFADVNNLNKELQSSRQWTQKEIEIVLKNGNDIAQSYIELQPFGTNRTQAAITAKWRQLAKERGIDTSSGSRIPEDIKRDILYKHLDKGMSAEEIAKDINYDPAKVTYYLSRMNVNNDVKQRGFSANQFAEMIDMRHRQGKKWKYIAEQFNSSEPTIKSLFKRAGLFEADIDDFGAKTIVLTPKQINFIRYHIGNGTVKDACDILNINMVTVKKCFDRQGIPWAGLGGDVDGANSIKESYTKATEAIKYKDTPYTIDARNNIVKSYENCNYNVMNWVQFMCANNKPVTLESALKILTDTDAMRSRQKLSTIMDIIHTYETYRDDVTIGRIKRKDILEGLAKRHKINKMTVEKIIDEVGIA